MMSETPPLRHGSGSRTPMTVDGLVASIRRHVGLFRQDPEFVSYIVNLALYLIEVNEGKIPVDKIPEPKQGEAVQLSSASVKRLSESSEPPKTAVCQICGSPVEGERVCPHCGHMVM